MATIVRSTAVALKDGKLYKGRSRLEISVHDNTTQEQIYAIVKGAAKETADQNPHATYIAEYNVTSVPSQRRLIRDGKFRVSRGSVEWG